MDNRAEETKPPEDKPAAAKKYKVKLLKRHVELSMLQLVVFGLLFGAIGGYAIYKSLAASPATPASSISQNQSSLADLGHSPDELLIRFKPGASAKIQQAILNRYGAKVKQEIPQIAVKDITVAPEAQDAVKEALSHNPAVAFVEYNQRTKIADTTPNDPWWPNESSEVHTQSNKAWDTNTGDPSTIIAILDTGVDSTTPDLQGKILSGYDYINNDNDASDDNGHGTLVAGVAAADSNNSLGIASYCWKCTILPLKVMSSTGYGTAATVAEGITYAADHGAKIINMSLSGGGSSTEASAVQYAHSKNVVMAAAAGNNYNSTPVYPAAYPGVLGVAGTNPDDTLASGSDYGSWVSIAAPMCNYGTSAKQSDGSYRYASLCGTSSASPALAGIAGLLRSQAPAMSNTQIEQALTGNVDPCCNNQIGGGRVNAYKAVQALGGATQPPADTTPPTTSISSPTAGATVSGGVSVNVSASDNVGVTKVELRADGSLLATAAASPYSFFWDSTTAANGSHTLTATAYDAAGNTSSASATVTVSNQSDTTAPNVTVSSPVNGSTVGSKVTISASATDNVGVVSMEVYVDGILKGSSTSGSVSVSWSSRKAAAGIHTILVKAYDAANNVGQSSVTVTK